MTDRNPSPRRSRSLPTGLVAGLVLATLTGCGATVTVPAPSPDPAAAAVCAPLMATLPDVVLQGTRREVSEPALTAAWGDPPITLSCGVPAPPTLTATSECLEVDGVGWFAEQGDGGVLFTTIGRRVFVELRVPAAFAPEPTALTDVAAAVAAHDPVVTPCA